MELPKLKKVSEVKKKKIILLSDDLRMSSGVGTMSREIVMGTIKEYDWVQVAGAIKHPDNGKIVDLNQATREETGIEDAYLKLYPVDGYGNEVNKNTNEDNYMTSSPVKSFPSNGYGLFDMAGNVWEMVADKYEKGYYARSPIESPKGAQFKKGKLLATNKKTTQIAFWNTIHPRFRIEICAGYSNVIISLIYIRRREKLIKVISKFFLYPAHRT